MDIHFASVGRGFIHSDWCLELRGPISGADLGQKKSRKGTNEKGRFPSGLSLSKTQKTGTRKNVNPHIHWLGTSLGALAVRQVAVGDLLGPGAKKDDSNGLPPVLGIGLQVVFLSGGGNQKSGKIPPWPARSVSGTMGTETWRFLPLPLKILSRTDLSPRAPEAVLTNKPSFGGHFSGECAERSQRSNPKKKPEAWAGWTALPFFFVHGSTCPGLSMVHFGGLAKEIAHNFRRVTIQICCGGPVESQAKPR